MALNIASLARLWRAVPTWMEVGVPVLARRQHGRGPRLTGYAPQRR